MMHLLRQAIGNLRNAVGLGVVSSVNDAGQAQTVNLATGDGVNRADVEVAWPFGFSSVPPGNGMIAVVVAVGGDPSNLMALPVGNPSARFGGLKQGETVVYGAQGSRLHFRASGNVDIYGAAVVTVFSEQTVIDAPNGCTVNGNLVVNGNVSATGNVTWGSGTASQADGFGHAHNYNPGTGAVTETSPPVPGT